MYHPKRLRLINFMSHKDSEFHFAKGVTSMIYGVNITDEETESNGAGKSAILEGISVALINAALRKVSTKDLVTDGEIESIQEIDLFNPISNIELKIKRTIFSNTKSGKLDITINGKAPDVDLTSVDDGNKFILDTIGIGREDLLNYFLISKEKYEPFLNISDTKKKAIISRFSQATLIDPVFEEVDSELDTISDAIEEYEECQRVIDGKIKVYQEEITSFSVKSLEEARDRKIVAYTQDIEESESAITSKRGEIDRIDKEVVSIKEEESELYESLEKFKDKDFRKEISALEDLNKEIDRDLSEERVEYVELEKLEAKIRKGLSDAVSCPKCLHEFSLANGKLNVVNARAKQQLVKDTIKESEEYSDKKEKSKIKNRSKINEYETELRKHNKIKRGIESDLESVKSRISRKGSSVKTIEKAIDQLYVDIEDVESAIKLIKEKAIKDKRSEYRSKIKELELEIVEIVDRSEIEIEKKAKKSELKETLIKFKTYLSNKAIGAIEANANEYLENTHTDLSIQLDGYKMNRQGKIRENISVTILRDGLPVGGGYGRLSSGEKVRIEIAIIMSLQKLINNSTDHEKGLDLVWLDEIVESVDSKGIGGIMKSLNSTNQTIAVITHGTFNQVYPHTITVIKEDGISRIEKQ